ncbi:hypothetical protein ABH984_004681 [Bradyrhizobium ottawaense]
MQKVVDEPSCRDGGAPNCFDVVTRLLIEPLLLVRQKFCETDDVPERGTQIVRNRIGKRLQLLVGGFQPVREFSTLLRSLQHKSLNRRAEAERALHFCRSPRLRLLTDKLFPKVERLARMKPAGPALHRLVGIASPSNRLDDFGPEPDDVIAPDLRDGDRQHTTGFFAQELAARPYRSQRIRFQYVVPGLEEPRRQITYLALARRLTGRQYAALHDNCSAFRIHKPQPFVRIVYQPALKRSRDRKLAEQRRLHALQLKAFRGTACLQARANLQRHDLSEDVACGADLRVDHPRGAAMPGDEPPQRTVDDD